MQPPTRRTRFRTPLIMVLVFALGAAHYTALADTPEEQLAAASALFEAQKYSEAAARLDAFLAQYPRHPRAGAAAFALGRSRTELKQYDKAIPAYQKAIATNDPDVLTLSQLGLGEAAINMRAYAKAAPALEAALNGSLKPQQASIAWFWLGQADYDLKQYDKSDEAYLHVIQQFPKADYADSAMFGAGLAELKLQKIDEARTRFRTVIDQYPRSENRTESEFLVAQIDLNAKRYPQARTEFETVLNNSGAPTTAATRAAAEDGLIQCLLALNDYAAATSRLQSALQRLGATDPERFRAEISLGNCYYRQKDYAPALTAYLDAAKSMDPAVAAEGIYWAANADLALEHPGDAASLFSKFTARYPKHELASRAALKAGDALVAAHQASSAMSAYRIVVEKYPASPEAADARKALGTVLDNVTDPAELAAALKNAPPAERAAGQVRIAKLQIAGKHFGDAVSGLTESLKLKPDTSVAAESNYLLGLANEGLNRFAPAAAAYAEAVRLDSSADWAVDAQGRLAWLYLDLKQPASAEKAADAALALNPVAAAQAQARRARVQALVDQQKWEAALTGCKVILDANPAANTVASILYTEAWVNERRNMPDQALPIWQRLVGEFPKSTNIAEALIHIGDASLKAEKYTDAAPGYQRVIHDYPTSPFVPEAHFKLGSCLYNTDKAADAAVEFASAADDKNAGDYIPEALYWTGVALEKSGKKDEAIIRLTKLVTLYPKHARTPNAKIRLAALKAVAGS